MRRIKGSDDEDDDVLSLLNGPPRDGDAAHWSHVQPPDCLSDSSGRILSTHTDTEWNHELWAVAGI